MKFIVKNCRFGRGLFATRPIPLGETILVFTGPIISQNEVDLKSDQEEANPMQIGDEMYIDLQEPGVLANHSCNPNAGIQNNINLIALKDINAGDEIMYDYSTTIDGGWTMPCDCQDKECRKEVYDFKDLPQKKQEHYLKLGIVQRYIVKKYRQ